MGLLGWQRRALEMNFLIKEVQFIQMIYTHTHRSAISFAWALIIMIQPNEKLITSKTFLTFDKLDELFCVRYNPI